MWRAGIGQTYPPLPEFAGPRKPACDGHRLHVAPLHPTGSHVDWPDGGWLRCASLAKPFYFRTRPSSRRLMSSLSQEHHLLDRIGPDCVFDRLEVDLIQFDDALREHGAKALTMNDGSRVPRCSERRKGEQGLPFIARTATCLAPGERLSRVCPDRQALLRELLRRMRWQEHCGAVAQRAGRALEEILQHQTDKQD